MRPSTSLLHLLRLAGLALAIVVTTGQAREPAATDTPFADIHLHFNWDQLELLSAADAVQRLRQNHVVLGVVSSTPSDHALLLAQAGKGWIIPLFSPYITAESRNSWFRDPQVLQQARQGLAQGLYQGIGELHLWAGMKPAADNTILQGLFALALEYDVPMLIHTESSSYRYFARICQQQPKLRFLWAHAGGRLGARDVKQLMQACPNVWVELSARDPWRYASLVDKANKLPPDWQALIEAFPDRFMTGSDPVWNVTRTQRWDEADAGWDHLSQLINFHRHWLRQLPAEVERKVRLTNARKFFRAAATQQAPRQHHQ